MNYLLEENHFSILLPHKTPNSSGMRFLKNHDMEKKWKKNSFWIKTFEKNQILKQVFNNASDFESRISKNVRFLVNSTQLVIFWIGIFTSWRILKHLFYHTSDFKQNFQRRKRFLQGTGFEKWIFLGQFAFKKSFKTCQNLSQP